jgi:hypothetical protein
MVKATFWVVDDELNLFLIVHNLKLNLKKSHSHVYIKRVVFTGTGVTKSKQILSILLTMAFLRKGRN